MGRMLTQEFLPHFLSVVLNSKHWAPGENSLFGHPKIHKMTSSCVTDFSAAPSPNTHGLSKPLLYIPASWVLYLQKAKTFLTFALLVCHVSSVVKVPTPAPGSNKWQSVQKRFLRLIIGSSGKFFFPFKNSHIDLNHVTSQSISKGKRVDELETK